MTATAAESTLKDVDARNRKELKATSLTIVLTGKASGTARKGLTPRGWPVS